MSLIPNADVHAHIEHQFFFVGERVEKQPKFYKCIFNEGFGIYDAHIPHKHKVKELRFINRPGYVYHGYAFLDDVGRIKVGCDLNDFVY